MVGKENGEAHPKCIGNKRHSLVDRDRQFLLGRVPRSRTVISVKFTSRTKTGLTSVSSAELAKVRVVAKYKQSILTVNVKEIIFSYPDRP